MKKLVIDIYDKNNGVLNGLIEINSKDLGLLYFEGGLNSKGIQGLQSNYSQEDDKYKKQMKICSEIVRLVSELNEI